jgi:hypothetical protein
MRTLPILPVLFCSLLALTAGCRRTVPTPPAEETPTGPAWFEDVTEQMGLDFVHDPGPTGTYFFPQIMGSGCALFDFDNDGRLDLYLIQNAGPKGKKNRLFRNADGHFEDVSAGSGVDVAGFGMGAAVGDVNNDGLADLYLSEFNGAHLFLNLGGGKFRDVTGPAGLASLGWGTSACFTDYDRDGWLDLVVTHYVDYDPSVNCSDAGGRGDYCHPSRFPGGRTRVYRNRGRTGGTPVHFEDATASSGVGKVPGSGLGVVAADFTGDGWPDLFVANDARPNRLWVNQKDGTFKEEAVLRGVAGNAMGHAEADMGVAVGDVDGDGLMDLLATHLTEETHTLWRQERRGLFRDRTVARGLGSPRRATGFGTALVDFDQDGHLDLVVAAGRVAASTPSRAGSFWPRYVERNQLFANDGKGHFRDVSPDTPALCGTPRIARGLACGDIDGDGALDLVVTYIAGPARVYRNVAPERGHWLLVRALETHGRDALGAEITLRAGKKKWAQLVNPGQSYLSSHDPRAHFGLGKVKTLDEIRILWPDGSAEVFPGSAADRPVVVRQGQGKAVKP